MDKFGLHCTNTNINNIINNPYQSIRLMTTLCDVESATVFQAARGRIEEDIGEIMQCLNSKKVEMFTEISRLEKEFSDKQQQQQKELNKLNSLKFHAEDLGENNLLRVQYKLILELQQEIDALTLVNKQTPDYNINIAWGFSNRDLVESINSSKIERIGNTTVSLLQEYPDIPVQKVDDSFNIDFNWDSDTISPVVSPTLQTRNSWTGEDNPTPYPFHYDPLHKQNEFIGNIAHKQTIYIKDTNREERASLGDTDYEQTIYTEDTNREERASLGDTDYERTIYTRDTNRKTRKNAGNKPNPDSKRNVTKRADQQSKPFRDYSNCESDWSIDYFN